MDNLTNKNNISDNNYLDIKEEESISIDENTKSSF